MDLGKELAASSAAPLVLSILAAGGEAPSAVILASLSDASGGVIEWSSKTLDQHLVRLTGLGLAASRWEGRKRKLYAITPAGREALAAHKEQWRAVQAALERLWRAGQG